jgi:hypothetical protein
MHVFVVRPFGTRRVVMEDGGEAEVDFAAVQRALVDPALAALGMQGGTTEPIAQAGDIRKDVFELLATSDLVVADISMHNANVFYELGVRHALRDHGTVLIRCRCQEVPFDLRTDRYLEYDPRDPAASLPALIAALRDTRDSDDVDSPVLAKLPAVEARLPDWSGVLGAPSDFREEVRRAAREKRPGDLRLLSDEARHFRWKVEGLRAVGAGQVEAGDRAGARTTWERVREHLPDDAEANSQLATLYQKLGQLAASDEAVQRVIDDPASRGPQLAEALALKASNTKARWMEEWQAAPPAGHVAAALRSPRLMESYGEYVAGFREHQNHFYPGINALALLTLRLKLAELAPGVWAAGFETEREAEAERGWLAAEGSRLVGAVELALEGSRRRLELERRQDRWVSIAAADLAALTKSNPALVAERYRQALTGAESFYGDVVRRQLAIYAELGVLAGNAAAALAVLDELRQPATPAPVPPERVIVFTGHRLDVPGRAFPRFPAAAEGEARAMIRAAVEAELGGRPPGGVVGCAGGANGGDVLFHEVCGEMGIPSQLFLAGTRERYVAASVADAGPGWVARFDALLARCPARWLGGSAAEPDQPRWLRPWRGYTVWDRSNLWLLHNALVLCGGRATLLALWDGREGDGPGGTARMVEIARAQGVKVERLPAERLASIRAADEEAESTGVIRLRAV